MNEDLPPEENMWLRTFGGLFLALLISAILAGLLLPVSGGGGPNKRSWAKTDTANLVAAVKAYNTEYGKYPGPARQGPFLDIKYLDAESNAVLLRILRGLDATRNPRKIVFFEAREWKPDGLFSASSTGGFDPKTCALLDPWGNPYHIVIDADYDDVIANPCADDPPIQTGVIVWSLGKDGQQGAPGNPGTVKGSDDVTSWR